jgi:hypothetical protein
LWKDAWLIISIIGDYAQNAQTAVALRITINSC